MYFILMVFKIYTGDCYQIIFLVDKMGCLCSKFDYDQPNIKIIEYNSPVEQFDYLRPNGTIKFSIDKKYNISIADIKFNGWYENSVRLWLHHNEQREHFYCLRGLLCRLQAFVLMIVATILFFSEENKLENAWYNNQNRNCFWIF